MNDEPGNHQAEAMLTALRRVRRRVRGLLVAEAAGRLIVWAILIAAGLALLDWWVKFPGPVRVIFLIAGLVAAGVWSFRHLWRPLTAPIPLDQLALGLTSLSADQKDRLAGTVAYLRTGGEGSPELWREVVKETVDSTVGWTIRDVLHSRYAARSIMAAVGAVIVLALAGWQAPQMVSTGAVRLMRPLDASEWPKSTQISPLTTDAVVAWGEAFTAQMRLDRGDRLSVRGYLTWSPSPHQRQRELMRRDADGVYRFTLENIRSPLTYGFSAGDDDTSGSPFRIKVVHRPTVASARLILTPPAYASHLPTQTPPLNDAPVNVLRGSKARFEVAPDRPIGRESPSRASLLVDGRDQVPLIVQDSAGSAFAAEFVVDHDASVEAMLIDADGLESRDAPLCRIQVKQDEPPSVVVRQPSSVSEATPMAVVELESSARDDVGLAAFSLHAAKSQQEFQEVADLLAATGAETGVEPAATSKPSSGPPRRCDVVYSWPLDSFAAAPGDVIRYFVEARDGYQFEGSVHEPVRSPVMTIHVISPAQLADRLRSDLMAARGPLRDLLTELLALHERTKRFDEKPSAAQPLDAKDRQSVEELVNRLQRWGATGRDTAQKIEHVARKAGLNGAAGSESARQAARLARRLGGSVDAQLKQAAQALSRAGESREAAAQHEHLQSSQEAQGEIAESLQSMLQEMERWSDFEELVRKLRELLDRQESLQRESTSLARAAGRLSTEEGESSLPTQTARAAAAQSQLRADAAALVESMRTWARERLETDPSASLSVEAAARVAEEKSPSAAMDEAARALAEGRFGRASELQRDAATVLRAMLAALEQKPDRELADLSRELQDVTARLRKIIQVQEILIGETDSAAERADANEVLPKLADRQTTLQKTTGALVGKVKGTEEEGPAAKKAIAGAADRMAKAGDWLEGLQAVEARGAQTEALGALEKALALLEHLEARTEQAMAERSLAQILAMLGELRRAQAALRGETAEIQGRSSSDRRLSRADGLKAARLAKDQRGLTTPLQEVREKLAASIVYDYVCEKIAARMESAAVRLEEKDCTLALGEQDAVLRELASLLEAASEEPKKDANRFVADSGGGGAGSPTPEKPVPTLAELKVLRRMQAEVGAQTAALDRSMPDPLLRSEAQLKEVQAVGDLQRDIHDLAVKMIEKAGSQGQKEE